MFVPLIAQPLHEVGMNDLTTIAWRLQFALYFGCFKRNLVDKQALHGPIWP